MRGTRIGGVLRLTLVLGVTAGLAVAAHAAGTPPPRLDQSEIHGKYSGGVGPGLDGQTFTAGITGTLESVQLPLGWSTDPGPIAVQLRRVVAGVPSDYVLSSAILYPPTQTRLTPRWLPIPLTAPSEAGVRYAIVTYQLSGCDSCWDWPSTVRHLWDDAYSRGGEVWDSNNPSGIDSAPLAAWYSASNDSQLLDHPFKTFVYPETPTGITIPYQPLAAGIASEGVLAVGGAGTQPTESGGPRAGVLIFNSAKDWQRLRTRLADAVGATLLSGFPFDAHSAAIVYATVPYTPPPTSSYGVNTPSPTLSSLLWIKSITAVTKGYVNIAIGDTGYTCPPAPQPCLPPDSYAQAWIAVVLPPKYLRPLRHVHFTLTVS